MVKPSPADLIIGTICNDNFNPVQSAHCNICNKPVLGNQKMVACQCSECDILQSLTPKIIVLNVL